MPKYLIERTLPGAGSLDTDELQAASANSNGVLADLGPEIQWVHSYITDDKITCVYVAPDEEMVREHARRAGLPADAVMQIRTRIDPTTAEPVEERTPKTAHAAPSRAGAATGLLLALFLGLGSTACTDAAPDPVAPAPELAIVGPSAEYQARDVATDLAALRRVTAPYHDFEAAQAAGWTALIPHCRDNQPAGGMGWHYANPAYIDGSVAVTEPEALIYEPQENGSLTLVGIEYAIPFSILPASSEPPVLFGQSFKQNPGDALWMLHVWAWRDNPDGVFATWNPNVSCAYAS